MENELHDRKMKDFYRRLDAYLQKGLQGYKGDGDQEQAREELLTLGEELQVTLEELTERGKELEITRANLDNERRKYRDLFEFAPDGYLITDVHGSILEANHAAGEMLGVEPRFLIRKPLANFILNEDRLEFRSHLSQSLESLLNSTEVVNIWELRVQPRGRPPFFASLTMGLSQRQNDLYYQPENNPMIITRWLIQDISDRRQAQEALKQAHNELEVRVETRTAELTQANLELQQIAHELELRNRELQEFAFVASHDLQEPLRKVRAFAERLIEHSQEADSTDYLERIHSAAVRMQSMLDGLLEYARVSSQARPLEPIDLTLVAREVLYDMELRVKQAGAHIELEPLPTIKADQLQMYRLFQNLISNAIKYRRPDVSPEIKISGETGADRVVLRFADNGIGFDMQHLDRLFKPFSRLQGRSKYDGSGMGLAICRKILERHSGDITAESVPNQGATFIVTLPCKTDN